MTIVAILFLHPYGKTKHKLSCLKNGGPIYLYSARDLRPRSCYGGRRRRYENRPLYHIYKTNINTLFVNRNTSKDNNIIKNRINCYLFLRHIVNILTLCRILDAHNGGYAFLTHL
jgi:hypothetical protein